MLILILSLVFDKHKERRVYIDPLTLQVPIGTLAKDAAHPLLIIHSLFWDN